MRFGLFGSAAARRPTGNEPAEFDSSEGFRDFIEYNVEAEALGFHGTFVVEHHFAGFCVDMDEADARFNECLDVIVKAWTSDRPFSHRGKYWAFDNIVVEPPA